MTYINSGPNDSDDIYRYLMSLLARTDDLSVFLQKVYLRFNMPIIVTDIAFHLIAYGGPFPCPDPLWQTIITSGAATTETINNYYFGEGFTDKMSSAGKPIDASWGINADHPQTTCAVYLGNSIEGCCSVLYLDPNNLDFALRLNMAVTTAVEIFLDSKLNRKPINSTPDRLLAARILLENTSAQLTPLQDTAYYKSAGLNPFYMVAAVHMTGTSEGRLGNIISNLKIRYPNMLYLKKADDMYLFFQNIQSPSGRDKILEDIKAEVSSKTNFICGVSDLFSDLEKRGAYDEQARLALDLNIAHGGDSCVYSFYDHYTEIILRHGCCNISQESLVLPEIRRLIEFDKNGSTDYFHSLCCYIFEHGDTTKAAAKLYVHRNSLMYRIKKCEEIMRIDLSDSAAYEKIWMCCKLICRQDESGSQ